MRPFSTAKACGLLPMPGRESSGTSPICCSPMAAVGRGCVGVACTTVAVGSLVGSVARAVGVGDAAAGAHATMHAASIRASNVARNRFNIFTSS